METNATELTKSAIPMGKKNHIPLATRSGGEEDQVYERKY